MRSPRYWTELGTVIPHREVRGAVMAVLIMVGLGVLLLCVAFARRLGSEMVIALAVATVVAIVVVLGFLLILIAIGMHARLSVTAVASE
jgi:hypothetical protein